MTFAVTILAALLLLSGCGNGGSSSASPWRLLSSSENFSSFAFSDEAHGWAVEFDIPGVMMTSDGGRSWHASEGAIVGAPSQGSGALPSSLDSLPIPAQVLCLGRTVFVTYYAREPGTQGSSSRAGSGVLASTDGGKTWRSRLTLAPSMDSVLFLAASDPQHLWALCAPGRPDTPGVTYLLRSSDGGGTWARLDATGVTQGGLALRPPLVFVDALHGWSPFRRFADAAMQMLRTTSDGGLSWERVSQPPKQSPWGFFALDKRHAWATAGGMNAQSPAALDATSDGGKTWVSETIGHVPLSAVFFVDVEHGWVVASAEGRPGGAIYATSDGGRHWSKELGSTDASWGNGPWAFCRAGNTVVASNGVVMFSRPL